MTNSSKITHPAKYSDNMIPIFAEKLQGYYNVLDPMAGTGKLQQIRQYNWTGRLCLNEIEVDWLNQIKEEPFTVLCKMDAAHMDIFPKECFDAICTSPTYGNRLADHWKLSEEDKAKYKRYSYTFCLGHDLKPENTGHMHWGTKEYREKHIAIYKECIRVLKKEGIFILNISNFIRNGREMFVKEWHGISLCNLGLDLIQEIPIKTKRMRNGANNNARVECEWIMIFKKGNGLK